MSAATIVASLGALLAAATVAAIAVQVYALSRPAPVVPDIEVDEPEQCFDAECVICALRESLIIRTLDAQTVADAERWGRELGGSR